MNEFLSVLPYIVTIISSYLSFLGGKKSGASKKTEEYDSLNAELAAFKNYRQLLIDDNNSLIDELKEMKLEMAEMKKQLKEILKSNCANFETCKYKKYDFTES